jgi:hypothetical protein
MLQLMNLTTMMEKAHILLCIYPYNNKDKVIPVTGHGGP